MIVDSCEMICGGGGDDLQTMEDELDMMEDDLDRMEDDLDRRRRRKLKSDRMEQIGWKTVKIRPFLYINEGSLN